MRLCVLVVMELVPFIKDFMGHAFHFECGLAVRIVQIESKFVVFALW